VAQGTDNLAFTLSQKGDLDSAEPLYREALELEMRILGPDHPDVAVTQRNLAKLLIARKQFPEAEDLLRRCLDVRTRSLPASDIRTLVTRLDLARVLMAQGMQDPADALIEEALEATKDLAPGTEARGVALTQAAKYYGRPRTSRARGSTASLGYAPVTLGASLRPVA
jgi:tetratricopeptide (TPR) repeat protein